MGDAIGPLFDAILAKIEALAIFAEVKPALNGGQLAIPSAEVWLAEMKPFDDTAEVTYDLVFAVQVTVGNQEDGTSQAAMHQLLEILRRAFTTWQPDFVGVMPVPGPTVKIVAHEDHGKTAYVLLLPMRVFFDTFGPL